MDGIVITISLCA